VLSVASHQLYPIKTLDVKHYNLVDKSISTSPTPDAYSQFLSYF